MKQKNIALVAHDNKKKELVAWAQDKAAILEQVGIYATGTTGRLIQDALNRPVTRLLSGPLGGDLLRIAALYNIPVACNKASADFMIHSPLLMEGTYQPDAPDFSAYTQRQTPAG
ncbi:MAG: methylglyoxal synthase [Reinekea sp.]